MSTLMNPSLLRTLEVSGRNWAAFMLTGSLVSSGPAVRFRKMWAGITLPGALSRLRSCGEASGNCGPASTLTGAPELPQDPWGHFRKMWHHFHSGRSSQPPQDIS